MTDAAAANRASRRKASRVDGTLVAGLALLGLIALISILGPLLSEPSLADVGAVRPRRPPSPDFWLGTDAQGRDMLTLMLNATPNTLKMGLIAGMIGVGFGTLIGLISGQFGGWIDTVISVISDSLMTVPAIAILVIIAGNVSEMTTLIMALVVASLSWMFTARTVRAQVLTVKERGYVEVARVNGEGPMEILFREVMPNVAPYILASFVGTVSAAILATIGLEALGLGAQNELTLGNTIYWAQQSSAVLRGFWWWWAPPIVIIAVIFVGLFLTSVGFDRFANPRLGRE